MALRSERRFIALRELKSGMMVQFSYTKKTGEVQDYTALVIDPDRTNDHALEPQLHAYLIQDFSDLELVQFISSFGMSVNLDYENRKQSIVENLNSPEAYKQFASSRFVTNRAYRTFNLSKISKLRQILVGDIE